MILYPMMQCAPMNLRVCTAGGYAKQWNTFGQETAIHMPDLKCGAIVNTAKQIPSIK